MPFNLKYDLPLSDSDLVSVVLFGAFQERKETREERWSVQFTEDMDYQLMEILNREKHNIPLIREHYFFNGQGAFPYSKEVAQALWQLAEVGALTRIMGEPGRIARPLIGRLARDPLERGKISEEDYQKFLDLGKELGIKRVVCI